MTLTSTAVKVVAQGNSANTVWPYTFPIPDQDSLIVTLVNLSSGDETILAPSVYTVTGLGTSVGGTVTYPLSGSPLTTATDIVIERFVPEVQETDLVNQGGAYPQDIEDALDYVMMVAQQLQDQVDRCIVFSVADTVEQTLPLAEARANLFLGFDSSGAPIAVDGLTPGTTVSAAMIPVVTAPTTADALTALGLPGNLLNVLIPSGVEWAYNAGGAAPTGFVFPIGQPCTPTYPDYRAKLVAAGSPYGTNGTDPLMPDRRSTVAAGKSNMGGVDNALLTGGTVLGAVLGAQSVALNTTQIPSHTHTGVTSVENSTHTHGYVNGSPGTQKPNGTGTAPFDDNLHGATTGPETSNHTHNFTTDATGNGSSHTNVQPTFICNIILKVH